MAEVANYLPGIEPPANHPQMLERIQVVRTRGNVHEVTAWDERGHATCKCGMHYRSMPTEGPRGAVTCAKCLGIRKLIPAIPCTPDKPGSGPAGETCKGCIWAQRVKYHDKKYTKCGLACENWTHGGGSDIKLWWPACSRWEPGEDGMPVLTAILERYGAAGEDFWRPEDPAAVAPMSDEIEEAGYPDIAWWLRKQATG